MNARIGLEIHVQLKTRTKLFCSCATAFEAEPNTHVCPVCLGLPGALPALNEAAVAMAQRAAVAFGCTVHSQSSFTRKNYFYPDLPKGYQITQYDEPLATNGVFEYADDRRVRIRRVHLEEDAAKLLHERFAGKTAIDMNRAGVPLLEIVTEPDLTVPADARAFLIQLKRTLQYLDVSDCEMEKGSLRVDANVSINGGSPTEIKNLNSFAGLERALICEIDRQSAQTAPVTPQTLSWNDVTGELRLLRAKEQQSEYRYMPEPDLPPLLIAADEQSAIPELPRPRATRFEEAYALSGQDANVLTASRPLADYFEEVARLTNDPRAAATWIMRDLLGTTDTLRTNFKIPAAELAELIKAVALTNISPSAARAKLRQAIETGARISLDDVAMMSLISDEAQANAWAEEVLNLHPEELQRYQDGEARTFEFLMGKLMRLSNHRLAPQVARNALTRAAAARSSSSQS